MKAFTTKLLACLPLFATAAALSTSSAALADRPSPTQVYVRNLTYAGSGCPAGTIAANVSFDASSLDLLFDSFIAEAGPGISLSESRKACTINLDLAVPAGWSYAIADVETRGFASLDAGTSATQMNRYYFQGSSQSATFRSTLNGPLARDYVYHDQLGINNQVWSPCGASRSLNLTVEARVQASGGRRALLTVSEVDGGYSRRYFLAFQRCH